MQKAFHLVALLGLTLTLGACSMFGGDDDVKSTLEPKTTALGVNGYLWQATLDTLSFLPIQNADPRAAVIVSDWHSTPDMPNERVKVTVSFLSQALRSDGIRVAVSRQELKEGQWIAVPVQAQTALQIEEAILTKARMLRVGS
ncbi:hypothetical protein GCM10017044_06820 [Kordiimonas sediminis]|uniref:DUF3576 domain-containing protein n=1 Tax=Kordiimonas sediminis TaxID=1735581 RepID=A0A919AP23_9PROT|nr:DUF3576 domain-containing protein [Kordiimonas sediminis]GHF15315.1 hypothetical protein GCM10017044_06820 [Kordiimonas sediminis]